MAGTRAAVIAALLIALSLAGFFFMRNGAKPVIVPAPISGSAFSSALTKAYANDTYQFSLSMPDGFTVHESPADEDGITTILLQNESGDGIQIRVTPGASGARTLSADDIRAAIPDLTIEHPEPVALGTEYEGVAFLSDNDAFDGASREVWFYFRGNLYQISTYARLDGLMKAVFSTWTFL